MRPLPFRTLQRLGHVELTMLLLVILCAGGLWFFAVLANHIQDHETHAFDRAVLLAMRTTADPSDPLGPPWFEEMMRDFTAFGGITWLTLLSLGAIGYLAIRRQIGMLCLLAVAVLGSWILTIIAQIAVRSAPTGVGSSWVTLLDRQFSQRSLFDGRRNVSHVGRNSLPSPIAASRQGIPSILGPPAHVADRRQSRLSRSSLADRRAGGLGSRGNLGCRLLADRSWAAAARPRPQPLVRRRTVVRANAPARSPPCSLRMHIPPRAQKTRGACPFLPMFAVVQHVNRRILRLCADPCVPTCLKSAHPPSPRACQDSAGGGTDADLRQVGLRL